MSGKKIDEFTTGLNDKLKAVEDRLSRAKSNLKKKAFSSIESVEEKRDEIYKGVQTRKKSVEKTRMKFEREWDDLCNVKRKQIHEWQTKREGKKLEKHADQAQKSAVDAILLAAWAVEDAELAILETVQTRMMADEAVGSKQHA